MFARKFPGFPCSSLAKEPWNNTNIGNAPALCREHLQAARQWWRSQEWGAGWQKKRPILAPCSRKQKQYTVVKFGVSPSIGEFWRHCSVPHQFCSSKDPFLKRLFILKASTISPLWRCLPQQSSRPELCAPVISKHLWQFYFWCIVNWDAVFFLKKFIDVVVKMFCFSSCLPLNQYLELVRTNFLPGALFILCFHPRVLLLLVKSGQLL